MGNETTLLLPQSALTPFEIPIPLGDTITVHRTRKYNNTVQREVRGNFLRLPHGT
jgi:hypothetical protein